MGDKVKGATVGSDGRTTSSGRSHPPYWVTYISLLLSMAAVVISGLVGYRGSLKPFTLRLWVDPVIQLQHRVNFGVYADLSFRNESPRPGLVTALVAIVGKADTPEDKYLLTFVGFRVADLQGVYHLSEETLPMFLEPGRWASRTASFIYTTPDQFPISSGTYVCEILVWTDYEKTARYRQTKRFEVNADVLNTYLECRDKGSTRLQAIPTVGAMRVTSRKISITEYEDLVK